MYLSASPSGVGWRLFLLSFGGRLWKGDVRYFISAYSEMGGGSYQVHCYCVLFSCRSLKNTFILLAFLFVLLCRGSTSLQVLPGPLFGNCSCSSLSTATPQGLYMEVTAHAVARNPQPCISRHVACPTLSPACALPASDGSTQGFLETSGESGWSEAPRCSDVLVVPFLLCTDLWPRCAVPRRV